MDDVKRRRSSTVDVVRAVDMSCLPDDVLMLCFRGVSAKSRAVSRDFLRVFDMQVDTLRLEFRGAEPKEVRDLRMRVIGRLTGLTGIEVRGGGDEVMDLLSRIPSPEKVRVVDCRAHATTLLDLSPLSMCTGLTELDVSGTRVSDLSRLSLCVALVHLNLCHARVSDLSPLSSCTGLVVVNLDSTEVTDVSPLKPCVGLT